MEVESEFIPAADKVISLSLDQVDSNPDGLVELRGEGRYFGAADDVSSTMLCSNCHQHGHKRAQCKTVVCHACGAVGDHYTERCPKSMVCYNCGERGHFGNTCKERARRLYCQICESNRHMNNRCPSIWRSYLTQNDGRARGLPNNMYCYNCADKGHFGDDCPEQRGSRMPNVDGSAFSGHNLPQTMREAYYKIQKKRKREDEKKGLLDRVKGVFKKDKDREHRKDNHRKDNHRNDDYRNDRNDYNYRNEKRDYDSKDKYDKYDKKSKYNKNKVRKSQSLPMISKSGTLDLKPSKRGKFSFPKPSNSGTFR